MPSGVAEEEGKSDNSIDVVVVAASALLNGDSLCCRADRELQVGETFTSSAMETRVLLPPALRIVLLGEGIF